MEKCPPAEACKEAFERMSKATVQMCLSTTGFGSNAEQPRQMLSIPKRPSQTTMMSDDQAYSNPREDYQSQSQSQVSRRYKRQPQPRRPPPKFDMNLEELFPEEMAQNLPLTSATLQNFNVANNGNSNNAFRLNQSQQGISPRQQQQQTPPSQLYTSQAQQQQRQPTTQSFPQTNTTGGPIPDFDFEYLLNANSNNANPTDPYNNNNQNFPTTNTGGTGPGGTTAAPATTNFEDLGLGFDFGFSGGGGGNDIMMNYNHDWHDGAGNFDLFDGFFFGGGSGGGG